MALKIHVSQAPRKSSFGEMWYFRLFSERYVTGPFTTELLAKRAAMKHYEGAEIEWVDTP